LYYLTDYDGNEEIKGGFYRFQLTPVNINTFRIEKILRRKKDRQGRNLVFVKWLGYDDSHNQWILESEMDDIN